MLEKRILKILKEKFKPMQMEIINESHMHSGPRTESHFKVFMVSEAFMEKSRVERQQWVMTELKECFEAGLHALSMRLKTPEELLTSEARQGVKSSFQSPECSSKSASLKGLK